MEIKELTDKETAIKVGEFLVSSDAFSHTWFPDEKILVKQAVLDSLTGKNHRYWYAQDGEKIVGAIGIRENKYGTGGYEMDADYLSVHKDYRRKGIASMLIEKVEEFVKQKKGRYIHILSCDTEVYKPALAFYEKKGYKKVAEMPNYYLIGEGRIDFFKEI